MEHEIGARPGLEQEVVADGDLHTSYGDRVGYRLRSRGVLTLLIEFPVVRQILLWNHSEQDALANDECAIEEPPLIKLRDYYSAGAP
jgi:hypothetical protein